MKAARWIYGACYTGLFVAALPYFAWKGYRQGKYFDSMRGRFWMRPVGPPEHRGPDRGRIWVHAVSVGEVKIARALASAVRAAGFTGELALTVTTATGTKLAEGNPHPFADVRPFPFDFAFSVRRAFDCLEPDILVLTEAELWPNVLFEARQRGVPVALINGRIGRRSHARYKRAIRLMGPALRAVVRWCVRTGEDADRIKDLGVEPGRITVTGSIKYDIPAPAVDRPALRRSLGLAPDERVLVAGSTLRGEEDAVLEAFASLVREIPGLRLVVAPRHPERFEEARRAILKRGFACELRSGGAPGAPAAADSAPPRPSAPVVLLDTIGELFSVYSIAEAAFVGGSLFPGTGGHSPLEPAAFGVPVVYGPHMENFADIASDLEQARAAVRLSEAGGLSKAWRTVLLDRAESRVMGERGVGVCAASRGAAARTAGIVLELLGPESRTGPGSCAKERGA